MKSIDLGAADFNLPLVALEAFYLHQSVTLATQRISEGLLEIFEQKAVKQTASIEFKQP